MKRFLRGLADFRNNTLPGIAGRFAALATGQSPEALLFACCDSRVVPAMVSSSQPGTLFIVRSIGNMVAPASANGQSTADVSEAAAIEFALDVLDVPDIVVLGHSHCGAMRAILAGNVGADQPNLSAWLRHARPAVARLPTSTTDPRLPTHDRLSQENVLVQLEHIRSYPSVKRRLAEGRLGLTGAWFDVASASVWLHDNGNGWILLTDEEIARRVGDLPRQPM